MSRIWTLITAAVVAVILSGCATSEAAEPDFSVQIPKSWFELSESEISAIKAAWKTSAPSDAISDAIIQMAAWSVSPSTTGADLLSNTPPQRLQAFQLTRKIFKEELAVLRVTPDAIEDVVLGLSSKIAGDGLEVRNNSVSTESNRIILQQEIAWDFSGITQTMRIYAAADLDAESISLFWIRCSDTCISEASVEIDKVFSSITRVN